MSHEPAGRARSGSSRAAPSPRRRGSRRSCVPRPPAGCCSSAAALAALVWANTPWSTSYDDLRDFVVGPEALHLDLTLGTWAADGLLALFFFVAGLELKREFVAGDLRDPRRAALPVAAAVGGMVVPALVYVALSVERRWAAARLGDPDGDRHRVRAGGPGGDQHPPAGRAAHVPAHARGRRRPAGDHRDRGVLHRRPGPRLPRCWRLLPIAVLRGSSSSAGCSAAYLLLPLAAGRVGAGARVRRARDRGRRAAGVHRAGPAPRRPDRRARAGRAPRAPGPARVRRRSRCRSSRSSPPASTIGGLDGLRRTPQRPGRPRRRARPGRRQDGRRRRLDLAAGTRSPGPSSTTTCRGWTSSGCRCSRASASRCRC